MFTNIGGFMKIKIENRSQLEIKYGKFVDREKDNNFGINMIAYVKCRMSGM